MRVVPCSGEKPCSRQISISQVPGGNPVANANPEVYAASWTRCACGAYTCDRCLAAQSGKCRCGQAASVLSERERIDIALGGPPPAPGAALPLRAMVEELGAQIDAELGAGHGDRARATAALAATLLSTQGPGAPEADLPWLSAFGERFVAWGLFAEGVAFWGALLPVLAQRGKGAATAEGKRAIAYLGACRALAGDITGASPDAHPIVSALDGALGASDALTARVKQKLGPLAPLAAHGAPPMNLAPPAPVPASVRAGFDGVTGLAVWLTLAFLDIASADGVIDESEHDAWKKAMTRAELPDVWARFGLPALQGMLEKGMLQDLSTEYATLPHEVRGKMGETLVDFMMADGVVDPREVVAVKKIAGWLGVTPNLPG
jgi:hypothetical protein